MRTFSTIQAHTAPLPFQTTDEPVRINVSARILDWPLLCSCCGESTDTKQLAALTHGGGGNFIRVSNENWTVPCCDECQHHMDKAKEAALKDQEIARLEHSSNRPFPLKVNAWGWFLVFVFFAISSRSAGAGLLYTAIAITVFEMAKAIFEARQKTQQEAEIRFVLDEKARLQSEAESLVKDNCCGVHDAVTYENYNGSIHTFCFSNREYAEKFAIINAKKMVQ